MNNVLAKIKPQNEDNSLNIIIEIEKGSKNKYELDKESGLIKLDRVLHTSQDYPFDYGFVPNTLWHDGDPLDVVLLSTYSIKSGTLVEARPIAMLDMVDNGESDVKVIAVPVNDPRFKNVNDLSDINNHKISEIKHFFETYKNLENKIVKIKDIQNKELTEKAIQESIELYNNK